MVGADMGARALSSDQARNVALLPWLALASAAHVALLMLVPGVGRPDAAPQSTPIPVTLVSVPLPEPPQVAPDIAEPIEQPSVPPSEPVAEPPPELALEPPAPQSVADSRPSPVSQVVEPVADLPPKPNQALPVTSLKVASIRTPRPVASRAVPLVAQRQAAPAPSAAAARLASDAPTQQAAAPAAVEASFETLLLQAVQAEARRSYPAAARLMGSTGQAVVAFEYRDGAVHVTGLAQTSGSPVLDRAALAAVRNASYPPPPGDLAGRTLVKLVHVKFELNAG